MFRRWRQGGRGEPTHISAAHTKGFSKHFTARPIIVSCAAHTIHTLLNGLLIGPEKHTQLWNAQWIFTDYSTFNLGIVYKIVQHIITYLYYNIITHSLIVFTQRCTNSLVTVQSSILSLMFHFIGTVSLQEGRLILPRIYIRFCLFINSKM